MKAPRAAAAAAAAAAAVLAAARATMQAESVATVVPIIAETTTSREAKALAADAAELLARVCSEYLRATSTAVKRARCHNTSIM